MSTDKSSTAQVEIEGEQLEKCYKFHLPWSTNRIQWKIGTRYQEKTCNCKQQTKQNDGNLEERRRQTENEDPNILYFPYCNIWMRDMVYNQRIRKENNRLGNEMLQNNLTHTVDKQRNQCKHHENTRTKKVPANEYEKKILKLNLWAPEKTRHTSTSTTT